MHRLSLLSRIEVSVQDNCIELSFLVNQGLELIKSRQDLLLTQIYL